MRYSLMLDNPKDFYHESHRAIHFLDFAQSMRTDETTEAGSIKDGSGNQDANAPDRDDFFQ
jgi:hypothetical protein